MKQQSLQKFVFSALAAIVIAVGGLNLAVAPAHAALETDVAAESASSPETESTDAPWTKQAPEGSNVEFKMPQTPRFTQRRFKPVPDEPFITVKTCLCSDESGQIVYTLSYHDLHNRPNGHTKINATLDGAVRGTVALVVGSLQTVEPKKARIYPGRKFTYSFNFNGQPLKSDAEVYLVGERQYMMSVIFKEAQYDPAASAKYFATFNPFDPEDDLAEMAPGSQYNSGGLSGFTIPEDETPAELK